MKNIAKKINVLSLIDALKQVDALGNEFVNIEIITNDTQDTIKLLVESLPTEKITEGLLNQLV